MEFEWNPDKAITNIKKHHVSFTEAATVFNDPLSLTYPDPGKAKSNCRKKREKYSS